MYSFCTDDESIHGGWHWFHLKCRQKLRHQLLLTCRRKLHRQLVITRCWSRGSLLSCLYTYTCTPKSAMHLVAIGTAAKAPLAAPVLILGRSHRICGTAQVSQVLLRYGIFIKQPSGCAGLHMSANDLWRSELHSGIRSRARVLSSRENASLPPRHAPCQWQDLCRLLPFCYDPVIRAVAKTTL